MGGVLQTALPRKRLLRPLPDPFTMATCARLLLWLYFPFLVFVVVVLATTIFLLAWFSSYIFTCALLMIPVIGLFAWNLGQVLWACRVLLYPVAETHELELRLPRKKY